MPTKTISAESLGTLYKYPSLTTDTITTWATGITTTGIPNVNYTNNITTPTNPHSDWVQDQGVTMNATCTFTPSEFHPEWNCKPKEVDRYNPLVSFGRFDPVIVNINIIVPNKVVEVIIFDGKTHTYKQVCKYPDDFDLTFALALAWIKYKNEVFKLDYTLEGIEDAAHEYMWKYKKPLKEFNRAIKAYNKWFKEETRKEVEEEERQAIIERRRAKNKKRKEKMKVRKKQEEINTIAEAIKLAKEN